MPAGLVLRLLTQHRLVLHGVGEGFPVPILVLSAVLVAVAAVVLITVLVADALVVLRVVFVQIFRMIKMFSLAFSGADVEHGSGFERPGLGLRSALVDPAVLLLQRRQQQSVALDLKNVRNFGVLF